MNINKLITLILILPALIISLSGCRGAGKYVDDVGKIVDNNADDAGRIVDNNADDAGRIVDNNTDEIINIAKERLIECAKSASKSSVEQTNKRPRRKQRGIVTLFLTFHTPQGAGNLPVILLKQRFLQVIPKFLSNIYSMCQ